LLRFSPGGSPAHTDAMGGGTLCYDLKRSSDGGDGGVDGGFLRSMVDFMVGFCSQALVATLAQVQPWRHVAHLTCGETGGGTLCCVHERKQPQRRRRCKFGTIRSDRAIWQCYQFDGSGDGGKGNGNRGRRMER
jgi:hypothetical protein